MSLSNNPSPKEVVTTYQALLDMAIGLKALSANPNLEQLAKDAYSLSESEQARADAARADIQKNQDLIAQQKQLAADLVDEQDNLDLRTTQINDALAVIESKNADLSKRESALKSSASDLSSRENDLSKAQNKLDQDQAKLDQDQQNLSDAQTKLAADQTALKVKSDQLKALIG